jgi:CDP-glycerol glycerophosphotransferase
MKDIIILVITKILRVLLRVLHLFPMKQNRVLFCSTFGKNCICNPKYISDYLGVEEAGKYEIIWAVTNEAAIQNLENYPVKTCKYHGVKYFYYMATSKVCIDNIGFISVYPARKNQILINTWHGGGCYKNVGQAEKAIAPAKAERERLSVGNTSLYLSSSKFFSENVVKGQFGFFGDVLEAGMPRNDHLVKEDKAYNQKISEQVHKALNIKETASIALYAPTWRYSNTNDIYDLDVKAFRDALTERFGGEWVILCRLHHRIKNIKFQDYPYVIDASNYPDMQKLLIAADVLVTDYSSSMWDYSFTGKPCLLFTVDLEQYIQERGFVKNIYEWGFPICKSNQELCDMVKQFDEEKFREAMQRHHEELGSCESGEACAQVAKLINKQCFGE